MKPVDIVKIDKIIPIFKNGEPANNIEVARIIDLEGNSCQFNIIVGKGLYEIGDKAVYIQPDYCIPERELFIEYFAPFGDPKKSKLGKKGRIRAVKFNFNFENEMDSIYSNGILMKLSTIPGFDENCDLQEYFGVIKYVSNESFGSNNNGLIKGDLPYFLYETDETRIEYLKEHIDKCYNEKHILSFSVKRDGSSISLFFKKDNINPSEYIFGVCSRNQEKKLEQEYISGYKDDDIIIHPYIIKETREKGWFNDLTQKFYSDDDVQQFEPVITVVKDSWVDTTKKYGYLDKLIDYCKKYNVQLALRGELVGAYGGSKGSGNKLNPDAKGDGKVIWFGVDSLESGTAKRIHYGEEHNLKKICEELELEYTQEIFEGVFAYDDIIKFCDEYFKKIKDESGQIIEGIVIRSKYSNVLSCKYLNNEYDSKS